VLEDSGMPGDQAERVQVPQPLPPVLPEVRYGGWSGQQQQQQQQGERR
jgi:hypothetical protein